MNDTKTKTETCLSDKSIIIVLLLRVRNSGFPRILSSTTWDHLRAMLVWFSYPENTWRRWQLFAMIGPCAHVARLFNDVGKFLKPRSRRLGGFLLCLRFIFLNCVAVGWAVSCSAFDLFFFKPRSRRLGGFLLCLRFIKPRSRRRARF